MTSAASGHVYMRGGKRGGVWYAKYRLPDGVQRKQRLGPDWAERGRPPNGSYTRRTAEAALRTLLTDAERGELVVQRQTGATFGDACTEWLRHIEHDRERRPSTVTDYRSVVNHNLLPYFGKETALERISGDDIERYRRARVAEARLANRTITKQLVILHGIFRRAQRAYGLRGNPAAGVDRPPVRRSGDFAVLSPDEVEALAGVAESEQDAALFTTAAFSGLRMGELRALRWSDVDFMKRLIHVRGAVARSTLGEPKSGRVRSVPMVDQVLRALDGLSRRELFVAGEDLIFGTQTGWFFDDSRVRRRYHAALDRAGLKRLRFHDLRHTFGTLAVQVFPLSDVKAYMGHANIETTMIYVHHVPRTDAAGRLSRALEEAGEGPPKTWSRNWSRTEQF